MWYGTIYPRIQSFASAPHILEIAPGYGRCTQFLLELCDRLTIVDITQKCIDACKVRFASHTNIEYHVNDGKTLAFLEDDSIDFVFSWDSLVHANDQVFASYLRQLAAKMRPGGFGFIHHSNMGAYRDPKTGVLTAESKHWRDTSVSAELFRELCAAARLKCLTQEIIEWEPGVLSDTLSVFSKESNATACDTKIFENHEFYREAELQRRIHSLYSSSIRPSHLK